MHTLSVWIGDSLLTPVDVMVSPSLTAVASPEMSLVQLITSTTTSYFENSDIIARVMIRDMYGNPLPDRGSEVVRMTNTPQGLPGTTFNCDYVAGKYYECLGWSAVTGLNTLSVTVNLVSPSMTAGQSPLVESCYFLNTCGAVECPCMQTRRQFSATFNVLTSPYGF